MPGVAIGVDRWRRHHEVSILIAIGGAGRYRGSQPRAKVSMMIMRLPQRGHGRGSARGCSSAAPGVSGCFGRAATPRSGITKDRTRLYRSSKSDCQRCALKAIKPIRAALYLRVSTGRRADNDLSIPDQRRQGKGYCTSRG
jgi:hypothetical protein